MGLATCVDQDREPFGAPMRVKNRRSRHFSFKAIKLSYGARGGSNYGNQRRGSGHRGAGKRSTKTNFDDGGFTAKELNQKFMQSSGSDLFEAKDVGDYWTIIFKPDGSYMGRYSKNEAMRQASEKNHNFMTSSPFVGLEIGVYDVDGKLTSKRKIVAMGGSDDLKEGYITALMDDGSQITRELPYFEKLLFQKMSKDPKSPFYKR